MLSNKNVTKHDLVLLAVYNTWVTPSIYKQLIDLGRVNNLSTYIDVYFSYLFIQNFKVMLIIALKTAFTMVSGNVGKLIEELLET